MCFSATASFTAAALLIPLGAAAVVRSLSAGVGSDPAAASTVALAAAPLLFGLQQAIEGFVWIGVEGGGEAAWLAPAALLYLFFAYGFWPAWIPFAVLRLEGGGSSGSSSGWRGSLTGVLLVCGLLMGGFLWLPLLFEAVPPVPGVVAGSLHYPTPTLFAGLGLNWLGEGLYAVVIGLPLLLSASFPARLYAVSLLAAFALSEWLYRPAFNSVWCYFSALLSILILVIVWDRGTSGAGILSPSGGPPVE
jgi:hypothetical protein